MPEFFVPVANTPEMAERVWQAAKKFAEDQLGWEVSDRRIFRVEYVHNGRDEWAEVGQPYVASEEGRADDLCLVILESNSFLVCTENRGVARGMPYLVGKPHSIIDFD